MSDIDALPFVPGTINYTARGGPRPFSYTFPPPEGTPWRNGEIDKARGVPIRDARPLAGSLSVRREGFEFHKHQTAVTDFYDADQVEGAYTAEVEAFLKAVTGADKVAVFDHLVRSPAKGRAGAVREPHTDYTLNSGPRRVRDHLSAEEAEARLARPFMQLNVWRPIRGPLEDQPLALCDARSIDPEDLVPSDLIYRDKVGETYSLLRNAGHRWFYFPRMAEDEVIVLKNYDSDAESMGRFAAHSALFDPTAPVDVRPRESIETRALVFF